MCGEQAEKAALDQAKRGSPPRVRGTEAGVDVLAAQRRITPACAGNSAFFSASFFANRDHPRVCGEQVIVAVGTGVGLGSPPRVRGTGSEFNIRSIFNRITPACAGNRSRHRAASGQVQDHPRVCGEQISIGATAALNLGSPPRVRGTVNANRTGPSRHRITPACAGNRIKHNQFV